MAAKVAATRVVSLALATAVAAAVKRSRDQRHQNKFAPGERCGSREAYRGDRSTHHGRAARCHLTTVRVGGQLRVVWRLYVSAPHIVAWWLDEVEVAGRHDMAGRPVVAQ